MLIRSTIVALAGNVLQLDVSKRRQYVRFACCRQDAVSCCCEYTVYKFNPFGQGQPSFIMSLKIYFQIAIRLILLFSTGISISLFSSDLHNLLGDKICKEDNSGFIRDGYQWSGAHYWFFWLCFFLFILSLISFISSVVNILKKEYDINI